MNSEDTILGKEGPLIIIQFIFSGLEDRERYGYTYLFLIDPKENQESNQPTE